MEGFVKITAPLHQITETKTTTFACKQVHEEAFRKLKLSLRSSPILAFHWWHGKFILDTDASQVGVGAVLLLMQEGEEKIKEYYSKVLTKPERNYCVTRKGP